LLDENKIKEEQEEDNKNTRMTKVIINIRKYFCLSNFLSSKKSIPNLYSLCPTNIKSLQQQSFLLEWFETLRSTLPTTQQTSGNSNCLPQRSWIALQWYRILDLG